MERILFPVKIMNITQAMDSGYSHKGTKAIDCGWVNENNKKLYAPFTGIVKQIKTDSNAVWFQSKEKVLFADGTVDYATVRTVHDNDVSDLYVGKEIKQGEYYYKMGNKGNARGVHVHIEISKGHVTGYKAKNSYGNYEMPNTINVYDGFCLADDTAVQDGKGYAWKRAKDVKEPELKNDYIEYVVVKGDTLSGIASKYNTTYQELASYNSISNPNLIRVGQVIKIPTKGSKDEIKYTVKKGDTLSGIAKKYNTTWQKIYEDNKEVIGDNPNIIQPGWELVIK